MIARHPRVDGTPRLWAAWRTVAPRALRLSFSMIARIRLARLCGGSWSGGWRRGRSIRLGLWFLGRKSFVAFDCFGQPVSRLSIGARNGFLKRGVALQDGVSIGVLGSTGLARLFTLRHGGALAVNGFEQRVGSGF